MVYLFILSIVLILVLITAMFFILKSAVKKISNQTKAYFVDKLQAYDYLINEKEERLNEIDKLIHDKELGLKEQKSENGIKSFDFDYNVINMLNETRYQDQSLFELNKRIDREFNFNYERLIEEFVAKVNDTDNFWFCVNLRKKIDSDVLYDLETLSLEDRESYLKGILDDKEYHIYEIFLETMDDNSPEAFTIYLEELINLNNPNITVLVGNDRENYDYISKYVNTKVSSDIYRGIKIIYRDRIYDFSLNERNI